MKNPDFSIVIPSYLLPYPNAATYRHQKFIRALDSILNQRYESYEVIIVADGCSKTAELYHSYYSAYDCVQLIQIAKQTLWSGEVRNAGIRAATGKYITYLDTDDKIGEEHLAIIADQMCDYQWVWYDDFEMNKAYRHRLVTRYLRPGHCGTCNITHLRSLQLYWHNATYLHDWVFINQLMMRAPHYTKINAPQYYICHLPKGIDV